MSKSPINTSGVANSILREFWCLSGTYERYVLLEEFTSDEACSLLATGGQVFLEDSRAFAVLLVLNI